VCIRVKVLHQVYTQGVHTRAQIHTLTHANTYTLQYIYAHSQARQAIREQVESPNAKKAGARAAKGEEAAAVQPVPVSRPEAPLKQPKVRTYTCTHT
jgi:hypothetical protein